MEKTGCLLQSIVNPVHLQILMGYSFVHVYIIRVHIVKVHFLLTVSMVFLLEYTVMLLLITSVKSPQFSNFVQGFDKSPPKIL